jgi:DNA-binding transcriptional LysR family regulator
VSPGHRRVHARCLRTNRCLGGWVDVELRQLRYFVTLSEELHFGRAAAREHIVQSALSQQLVRLERELRVTLVDRSTHHVRLTPSGEMFLADVRHVLHRLECARVAARAAGQTVPVLQVAVGDATCDSVPRVVQMFQSRNPRVEFHLVEAGLPEQCRRLIDGRLDVGFGRAAHVPVEIASELLRRDAMGVLVANVHPFAGRESVSVRELSDESLLLTDNVKAPELNEFVTEMCRTAGFSPHVYPGRVESLGAAAVVVAQGNCVACVPRSCVARVGGTTWVPLAKPTLGYPWSLLWRADNGSMPVAAVLECARVFARTHSWVCCDSCLQTCDGGAVISCDHVS